MKFYIHDIRNLYSPGCSCQAKVTSQGSTYLRWVRAVCEPYTAGSLLAAWEVFRGRAYAFQWPKPGDFEAILENEANQAMRR